jgi:hypothetical protein
MRFYLFILLTIICTKAISQPFVDVLNFNYFHFNSVYKDSLHSKNETGNYSLGILYPKEFKNGNALLIRLGGEIITSERKDYEKEKLYSGSAGLGFQVLSANSKWKYMIMGIPKISGTLMIGRTDENFHYSAVGLITYIHTENLKFKGGLYYSKEFFGNFFVPLVSVEWKINNHWSTYGVLPSNYRIEYRFNNKLYTGLNFKSYTRSFLVGSKSGFVKNEETQVKLFLDYFIAKNILIYLEGGRTLGYNILQFDIENREFYKAGDVFSPFRDNFFVSAGLAYRIRLDLDKIKE